MTKQSKIYGRITRPTSIKFTSALAASMVLSLAACTSYNTQSPQSSASSSPSALIKTATGQAPGDSFDLSHWKITLPVDENSDGMVDGVTTADLQSFSHSDFFYLDEQGHMVFTSPNKGATTPNSKNTRSELRYMSRGSDSSIDTHDPRNNFALASHSNADEFASIGGKMEATLHVDHAPRNAGRPDWHSSYAAVIGQIHATKKPKGPGFGYGNEPLKIVYKKWPNHETGSVYWRYERNLERENPDRKDISYSVWGNAHNNPSDPGAKGVALGEDFSYTVNVYKDTMYLTFESPRLGTVRHQINLANNVDVNGRVDSKDSPIGYTQDSHYFKAGVYNQCRAASKPSELRERCGGTGDWAVDKANGDYAQVSFSRLVVSDADVQ